MRKSPAFVLALLITLVVAGNYLFFFPPFSEREGARVARAIDGDTIVLEDGRIIRLLNVNTPERKEAGYDEAKNFLSNYENKSVLIEIEGREKYGRILGRVYDEGYINLEIVKNGLGHAILVNENELGNFAKAQKKAFEEQRGIWKRSENYGCLSAEINKNDEFVKIVSNCDTTVGWTVKDESTHKYSIRQEIGDEIILYSGTGTETQRERYWKRGNVWNDDRDSIFIRDAQGLLVYYSSYGY